MSSVTVCIVGCGNQIALEKTIKSFLEFNTYPIERFVVSDNSGILGVNKELALLYSEIEFINDGVLQDLAQSIDHMYSNVVTKYIFNLSCGWEFCRSGFIEYSMAVLESDKRILNVHLNKDDIISHNTSGFTMNPSLKRVFDYKKIGSYSKYGKSKRKPFTYFVSKIYKWHKYYSVFSEYDFIRRFDYV
jgi:hypothetical protein